MPADARDPIVVTGAGLACSLGLSPAEVWREVRRGRAGIGPIPAVESPLPEGSTGGQAPDLPPEYWPQLPREARYLRWAVERATADAGLTGSDPRRAVVLGTTLHGVRAGGRFLRNQNPDELRAFLAGATMRLAMQGGLGLRGPHITTCSACSSSLGAIALGVTLLESGEADAVVAGGYDAIGEYVWAGFNSLRLVSRGVVRPFSKHRDGMKVGEGFGIVVLERLSSAQQRGARILATLEGWGESADAHHLTRPHPEGLGAQAAIRQAMTSAGTSPGSLGLIAAHATATPDNDASEHAALRAALGPALGEIPVVGFKSYLGHTLGGAGAVELILSIAALRDSFAPPCANVASGEVEFAGLRLAPPEGLAQPLARSLNISLGFGGANTCIVVARDTPRASARAAPTAVEAWITGIGLVLPGITGAAELNAFLGNPGALPADTIDDAQLAPWLNARRTRRLGPSVKFMLAAASGALADAGLDPGHGALDSASAILASMHGPSAFCYEYYEQIVREGPLAANPVLFAEGVPNAAAAHLSSTFGIRGGCQTLIGTRTAGLDALGLALLRIRTGAADRIVVGACEETHPVVARAYRARGVLRDAPLRPAAAAFLVESAPLAARRSARPLGVLRAYHAASGGGRGPGGALRGVIRRAPDADLVLASCGGTRFDRAEARVIRRRFPGTPVRDLPAVLGELCSVGPLIAAAGALNSHPPARMLAVSTGFDSEAAVIAIDRPAAGSSHG